LGELVVVSACLAGIPCAYDGNVRTDIEVKKILAQGKAIPLCPEILGGLSVPREKAEISGGEGKDVILKRAKVITQSGENVSPYFIEGAKIVLKVVKSLKIKKAILKSRSPSCGYGEIFDGTFTGRLKKGNGILAEMLAQEGVEIWVRK
jgi:uncharacterized protein YbbK (DUF523 family)